MSKPQVVLVQRQLPSELQTFLADFFVDISENRLLFSLGFEVEGFFAALEIVRNDGSKKTWNVKLPLQFVLAVADAGDEQVKKIGFI